MKPREQPIAAESLHDLFTLTESGVLIWKNRGPKGKKTNGKPAGYINTKGYVLVWIGNSGYTAHRIVFAMSHGHWPKGHVDHIDGDKANNRPSNLRDVTPQVNMFNRNLKGSGACGLLGVTFNKRLGKFASQINISGKHIHLGYFKCPNEAHEAYLKAKAYFHKERVIDGVHHHDPIET